MTDKTAALDLLVALGNWIITEEEKLRRIAQAIEEAEQRGAMQLLIAQETADDIIKESAIAEASVLADVLRQTRDMQTALVVDAVIDKALANLSPATQATMAVIEAAQYWQIGSHDTDRIRRLREAVTDYERVMGGGE